MLTQEQKDLLLNKRAHRTSFTVGDVVFECEQGEWTVTKGGKNVDVFTFSDLSAAGLEGILYDIFHNTEAVTFK